VDGLFDILDSVDAHLERRMMTDGNETDKKESKRQSTVPSNRLLEKWMISKNILGLANALVEMPGRELLDAFFGGSCQR
jgi:hypothetical protein